MQGQDQALLCHVSAGQGLCQFKIRSNTTNTLVKYYKYIGQIQLQIQIREKPKWSNTDTNTNTDAQIQLQIQIRICICIWPQPCTCIYIYISGDFFYARSLSQISNSDSWCPQSQSPTTRVLHQSPLRHIKPVDAGVS